VHLSVMADEHEPFSIACGSVLDERGSRRFAYEFTQSSGELLVKGTGRRRFAVLSLDAYAPELWAFCSSYGYSVLGCVVEEVHYVFGFVWLEAFE